MLASSTPRTQLPVVARRGVQEWYQLPFIAVIRSSRERGPFSLLGHVLVFFRSARIRHVRGWSNSPKMGVEDAEDFEGEFFANRRRFSSHFEVILSHPNPESTLQYLILILLVPTNSIVYGYLGMFSSTKTPSILAAGREVASVLSM